MANGFTGKQQKFIDAYLGEANFNAFRAAEIAGYQGNGNTLRAIGSQNLTNVNIKKEIELHFKASAMSKNEVLSRLAEQARSDYKFYINSDGSVDLERLLDDDKGHLVKGLKPSKFGLIVEFYDGQRALDMIGRHWALFTDKSEVVEIDGGSLVDFEEWKKDQDERENEASETLEQFDDSDD